MFDFRDFDDYQQFRDAWQSIQIQRAAHYGLFTFGESELPYFLVATPKSLSESVSVIRGEVKITRPLIITPDDSPEFNNFFEDDDEEGMVKRFIMSRTAAFSHLKFLNRKGEPQIVTDSAEEAVDKLNRQLDKEEDEQTAILVAPAPLAGFAIFRYAAEKVMSSAPDNIQELRERGFLP